MIKWERLGRILVRLILEHFHLIVVPFSDLRVQNTSYVVFDRTYVGLLCRSFSDVRIEFFLELVFNKEVEEFSEFDWVNLLVRVRLDFR